MPEKTGNKQDTKFQKGKSGNPNGRPKGSLNKATLAAKTLLDGEAEALTRKCVKMALEGDSTAMRLCLDRIVPKKKESPVVIDLPKIDKDKNFDQVTEKILAAVTNGEITLSQARSILQLFEVHLGAMKKSRSFSDILDF